MSELGGGSKVGGIRGRVEGVRKGEDFITNSDPKH